jgi:hypothetical protein
MVLGGQLKAQPLRVGRDVHGLGELEVDPLAVAGQGGDGRRERLRRGADGVGVVGAGAGSDGKNRVEESGGGLLLFTGGGGIAADTLQEISGIAKRGNSPGFTCLRGVARAHWRAAEKAVRANMMNVRLVWRN